MLLMIFVSQALQVHCTRDVARAQRDLSYDIALSHTCVSRMAKDHANASVICGMTYAYDKCVCATQQRTVLHESAYLAHYVGDCFWRTYLDRVALYRTLEPSSALLQVQSRGFFAAIVRNYADDQSMVARG